MERLEALEMQDRLDCNNCVDFNQFFKLISYLLKEIPLILKLTLKVGDVVVLNNNCVVKVKSNLRNGFSYKINVQDIADIVFSKVLCDEVKEISKIYKCESKYLILLKGATDDSTASFDGFSFYTKESKISFDFRLADIK